MFEAKAEISKLVEAIEAVTNKLSKGDMIYWRDLEAATGLTRDKAQFKTALGKVRRRLSDDRMIRTYPENGVGLRMLKDDEVGPVEVMHRKMKAYRQEGRILRAVETVNVHKLDNGQRLLLLAAEESAKRARREARATIRQIRKPETIPVRKVD